MSREKKTVQDWCFSCRFEETKAGKYPVKDGKYYKVREGHSPTLAECLNCLYGAVKDVKVTKPSNWRNDVEDDVEEG